MRLFELEMTQIEFDLRSIDLQSIDLRPNTMIYHGTDRPLESWNPKEDPVWTPAWFGLDFKIAQQYSKFARSGEHGDPIIITYKTRRSLNLLDVTTSEISEMFDFFYSNYSSDEIAEVVCDIGFDGWHIKDTEIMLCCTDDFDFVSMELL